MLWPVTAKIYWDPEYNVPLIKPPPDREDIVFKLRLTEPCDARPVFPRDQEKLLEAIEYEFSTTRLYDVFFRNQFLLFNKVPHWDQMWEVVASGNVVGQLYYDPFRERWRYRLNYTGAVLAVQEGLVDTIVVSEHVREKMVVRENYGSSQRQVAIVDDKGVVKGIGENLSGRVVVTKCFRSRIEPIETSGKPASLQDVLKHNEYGIYFYESRSKALIYSMASKTGKEVVVSYSGGKDSLVALHLTIETLGKAKLLFNDTGLELPETIENVDYVAEKYGLEKIVASAGDSFWKGLEVFGPPGKDYRWCCKIAKLVPLARTTKKLWSTGALNIVGQRAFESIDRARSPRVWRNRWIPHLLSLTPIQEWSQLHIWLYIYKYRLPYNRLYEIGYERLGCYLCPSSTLAEFREIERNHPQLWRKWVDRLEDWRKKLGQPIEWIKYGLWRWLTPATAKYRLVHHIKGYSVDWVSEYKSRLLNGPGLTIEGIIRENNNGTIVFNKTVLEEDMVKPFMLNTRMLGMETIAGNRGVVVRTSLSKIRVHGRYIDYELYEERGFEDLADVLKIVYRIHSCVKCGSCILWCPGNRITLGVYGPEPRPSCRDCRLCLEVCPVAEMLVEKIVLPLVTNRVDAWRRKTRYRREDVIKSFREMGIIPPP